MSVTLSGSGAWQRSRYTLFACARPSFDQIENHGNKENSDETGREHASDDRRAHDLAATAPAPEAVHSGTEPRMKANEVIKIGRRRKRAPSSAASTKGLSCSYSSFANSTIRIAFLAAKPISMTRPICE